MLLLAIDTSGRNGSIALARAGKSSSNDGDIDVIETVPLTGGTFSAQLIPQISALLAGQEIDKLAIAAFIVASGPGSFTGLRVGLAAVKALAEVLSKPVVAVSLLELCAFVSGVRGKVMAALDAGRSDMYVGEYDIPAHEGVAAREYLVTAGDLSSQAQGRTLVTPDKAVADIASAAGLKVQLLSPLSAADVVRLGWPKLRRGQTVAPDQLEANYIRRTDAELLEKIP